MTVTTLKVRFTNIVVLADGATLGKADDRTLDVQSNKNECFALRDSLEAEGWDLNGATYDYKVVG